MTSGSVGLDLFSVENLEVPPVTCFTKKVDIGRALISTGIQIELPKGVVGKIASRSGLSMKHNIEAGAGWIDSDYRGELKVELKNFSSKPFQVKIGDRIAQLIILSGFETIFVLVDELGKTKRGLSGFGSTNGVI